MARYETVIRDEFSGEVFVAKSNDYIMLQQKVNKKKAIWAKNANRQRALDYKDGQVEEAERLTSEALEVISSFKNVLKHTLSVDDKINWDSLMKNTDFIFDRPAPTLSAYMVGVPKKSFFEIFLPFLKEKRLSAEVSARARFDGDMAAFNLERAQKHKEFSEEVQRFNSQILNKKMAFERKDSGAITEYIEQVLENSDYPDQLDLSNDVHYDPTKRTVLIDMNLPNPEKFPKEIEFKYNKSKDEIVSKEMKKKDFEVFYEDVLSQICIRTIHEVFESLYVDCVDFVVFNGWVEGIDPKTGNSFNNCIVSVQVEKTHFEKMNLKNVSPLDCLKGLKGLIASEFINLAPVKPILKFNRNDKRIISADSVIGEVNEATNLAELDWQKFEVLIRDLFEKEFSGDGVDVKITQASRDAGVDAIIFDPDPIKGGKFVIQCKRYNNVVGVSAVRDLYGTLMNEGAVKGILVTTSHYGKDSIEFAKDKPITLINGQELVYMLNKHGVQAQIKVKTRAS